MTSVPVTTRPPTERTGDAQPPTAAAAAAAAAATAEEDESGWSIRPLKVAFTFTLIRPLKEFLLQQRSDATLFSKESELIAEVRRLKRVLTLCHLSNRPRLRPHPRPRAAPCAGGGGKRGNVGGSERQKAHNKHRHC